MSRQPRHDHRHLRTWLVGILLATLAGAASLAQAAEASAQEAQAQVVVQRTIDEVLIVLNDENLSADQKLDQIEAIATQRFDFNTISRLVVARSWKRLTPEQKAQFTDEFKEHLSLTYGKSVEDYDRQTVVITATRLEHNGDVTVKTSIHGFSSNEPVFVDYRTRQSNGDWLVIDVIVEGVSLLQNFRTQVQEIVSQDGPEGLIDRLHEKNAARREKNSI